MADAATTASGSEGAASSLPRSLNYVAGRFVPAASGRFLGVENPATGSVIAEIPLSAEEDVNAAADAAEEAFRAWRFTSFVERAAFLDRIADGIAVRAKQGGREGGSVRFGEVRDLVSCASHGLPFHALPGARGGACTRGERRQREDVDDGADGGHPAGGGEPALLRRRHPARRDGDLRDEGEGRRFA